MKKDIYFISTNGYDMVVTVDENRDCRYLTETLEFPRNMCNKNKLDARNDAIAFLKSIEDDSGFEDNLTYAEIFEHFSDDIEIIANIEADL